ncbi:MAG: hypothetical protein KUG77_18960, partial [Nannocystaceae bacterium]|nr:hypothetical protein [Nannocystaceae bacterium]
MRIGQNLLLIVALTVTEVSLTVGAAFQISKGATFHRLNVLHLKYNSELRDALQDVPAEIPTERFRSTVMKVREQPVACLELVNGLDRVIMAQIGTDHAIALCQKDRADADAVLEALDAFERGEIGREALVSALDAGYQSFRENSSGFEEPIARTVDFTVRTMIPLVLLISLFNIFFIS